MKTNNSNTFDKLNPMCKMIEYEPEKDPVCFFSVRFC
jgi:hypothetical protein